MACVMYIITIEAACARVISVDERQSTIELFILGIGCHKYNVLKHTINKEMVVRCMQTNCNRAWIRLGL